VQNLKLYNPYRSRECDKNEFWIINVVPGRRKIITICSAHWSLLTTIWWVRAGEHHNSSRIHSRMSIRKPVSLRTYRDGVIIQSPTTHAHSEQKSRLHHWHCKNITWVNLAAVKFVRLQSSPCSPRKIKCLCRDTSTKILKWLNDMEQRKVCFCTHWHK
jgi:hypothetical protein